MSKIYFACSIRGGRDDADKYAKLAEYIKSKATLLTEPSLGVGYELAKAEEWSKPTLALYYNNGGHKLSAMIDGSPKTRTIYYSSIEDAKLAIEVFIKDLS